MPNVTVEAANERTTVAYSPQVVVKEYRRTGGMFQRIEDFTTDLSHQGIIAGAKKAAATGKITTFPPGTFDFRDWTQGTGNYMASVLFKKGTGAIGIAGTYDQNGKPLTKFKMMDFSSHFNKDNYQTPTGQGKTQSQQAVFRCTGDQTFYFYDLELIGGEQVHPWHGIRTELGAKTVVENVITRGFSQGDSNSPPGETYTLGAGNLTATNLWMSGKLPNGKLLSSTMIGVFNGNSSLIDVHTEDMWAGFAAVYWDNNNGSKHYSKNLSGVRPGTGPGGRNGSLINIENGGLSGGTATYTFDNPSIILDGAWPNPLAGDPPKRMYPNLPVPRHEGKFGHVIVVGTKTNCNPIININDPVFEPWGHPDRGGFHVLVNHLTQNPTFNITREGRKLTEFYLERWWDKPAAFDPMAQFYKSDYKPQSTNWG